MPRQDITIRTADGSAPAGLFTPAGAVPECGVIVYMDAFGPRPALDGMAERLAGGGYAVLVPDLFYRHGPYGPFDARTAFADAGTAARIRGMMGATSQAMTQADTAAFHSMPPANSADEGAHVRIEPGTYLIPSSECSIADFTVTFPED